MALYHLDTSAQVKYYVAEPGSTWIINLIDAREPDTRFATNSVFVAGVTIAEGSAALSVLHRRSVISRRRRDTVYDRFLADLEDRLAVIDVLPDDFYSAAALAQRYPLKAYDAVQLATALRYNRILALQQLSITFVTGDNALLTAARAEGLPTDNPFDHVPPQDTPT